MCSSDVKHPIVQEIPSRRDFVCAKCGHELRECLPPSNWWGTNKKWVIPVAIVAALGIVVGVYYASQSSKGPEQTPKAPIENPTTGAAEPVVGQTEPEAAQPEPTQEGTPQEGPTQVHTPQETAITAYGGQYSGDKKNGKPHGDGTITYSKSATITVGSTQIEVKDGDQLEGEFRDGRLSGGYAYLKHADGSTQAIKL